MPLIQDKPVCFDCETTIENPSDIVFAPPLEEQAYRQVSACFHPLCLMRWRERRAEVRARMRQAHEAFIKHVTGECGCPTDD